MTMNPDYIKSAGIDNNHALLIQALIMANKPEIIIELGFGAGITTAAIMSAIRYNGNTPTYIIVDNWMDHNGVMPEELRSLAPLAFVSTSDEESWISSAKLLTKCTLIDFIVSDADHTNSHKWFSDTLSLLAPGGIAVFHDINTDDFPNLKMLPDTAEQLGYAVMTFCKSSRSDERCDRGLLVVQRRS